MNSELHRSLSRSSCERVSSDLNAKRQSHDPPYISRTWMKEQLKEHLQRDGSAELEVEEAEQIAKLEEILNARAELGDKQSLFVLGQFYFEQELYDKAEQHFLTSVIRNNDFQAMFQLGVIYYDGLGMPSDLKKGFEYMYKVATAASQEAKHLIRSAQFNVGLAYYQGYGVKPSATEAEKFWLLAADDGNPNASVKAQSILGLFYSQNDEFLDLKKAFYWHTEACGNGSLESQGALGVMYMNGVGTKQDTRSAFVCLRDATRRGNIYATGHLIAYYYKHKLFTKALNLAARVSQLSLDVVDETSRNTNCLPLFVRKGVAMACFYYARCLTLGRGIIQDEHEAKIYYSRSFIFDVEVCNELQNCTQRNEI